MYTEVLCSEWFYPGCHLLRGDHTLTTMFDQITIEYDMMTVGEMPGIYDVERMLKYVQPGKFITPLSSSSCIIFTCTPFFWPYPR